MEFGQLVLDQSLFDTKFSIPELRPGAVSRKGLIETARSSECRVVAVTAPAGYGKSTFLAQWAHVEDRPVMWVSLGQFDDDPATLLTLLATAYCRAGLGDADLVADMMGRGVSVLGRAAPRLASALHASPARFVLVLDNLHELRSPACHDVLDVLIRGIPLGSQLASASRWEQPHLARLRASGDALEFGPRDLALDAAGAQQIFAAAQVSLAPELAAVVTERTEGWPVGLHLAALIARDSKTKAWTITGDDRYVADYLYRETLIRQPEDMQRFLRCTAVLDGFCAPLCDAVLGSSAAAGQLRRLEAAGLFLIPLDRRRRWYRYHALFREFLLGELRRTEPEMIATLNQRAADWFESNGSLAQAIEHLLQTTDWDRSMRLVTKLSQPTYQAGQFSTVRRWYRAIGDVHIERYPPLAVLRCWEGVLAGDATAERWAAVVDAASFDLVPPEGTASFDSARAILRGTMCASGPEAMIADATFAVAQEPPWSSWRDSALWALAQAHLLAGHLDEARAFFAEASTTAVKVSNFDTVISSESELAWLAMDCGAWQEAADRLKLALATIEETRMHDYVFSSSAFAGAARLSLHDGDLDDTHRQLARAMRVRPSATYLVPYHAVRLRLHLATVYLAIADRRTARQLLREIDDVLIHRPALGSLINKVDVFRRALASSAVPGAAGRPSLTPAELRLLPYLQTHLTARGIAERLVLSHQTVQSEVKSIYRKLGVSSREEAVRQATAIGMLGA